MAEMLIQSESLTSIADKIRVLKDITEPISLYDMETELDIIPKNDSTNLTVSGATVTVPAGYYDTQATKSVTTATQATPSISINSSGLITASATQTAGYVAAGTKSGTKQLTTKAATTITPSTSNQTIASGTYLTGTQTIAGDADLKAENIKKGVNIFGVAGSYEGLELNFDVVAYDSEEALLAATPAENTIGVVTSNEITSWNFMSTEPTDPTAGMVWFKVDDKIGTGFNALKKNTIQVYPIYAKQYVGGAWVDKTAKSYQNGEWVAWVVVLYLYNKGNECTDITGGWIAEGKKYSSSGDSSSSAPAVTRKEEYIQAKFSTYNKAGVFYVKNPIDLTPYSKIEVTGEFCSKSTADDNLEFYVWTTLGTYYGKNIAAVVGVAAKTTLNSLELDISSLEGEYMLGFALNSGGNGQGTYVKMESCMLKK